ncbi:hypothetical protein B7R54_00815 [Subtercola boreus]|uniref:Glutathione S-transferase n=1 Tax=Subtercola boreus TaxID=120213 RepID=A0A3E0VE32_9MICO|nr:DUF952 domain-containing protein [Subtercola boreus]RFA07915.1 hypothetical protein B7R54_00815 [Subtercola boreus]TQL55226.1 uncharacterized protein (DUF952 family) [Subtercola boreus]
MQIFHIARAADWLAAQSSGAYTVSSSTTTLAEEGFIHASTAAQVGATAGRFYRDIREPLVVLVMDDRQIVAAGTAVEHEEAGNGERFPHIFGPIDPAWVLDARPAHFDDTGQFVY